MVMKAAVLTETGKPLRVMELDVPDLAYGQVLVRMAASGLCASQLREIRGERGPDRYLPHLLGHEGAGIVETIGPGVSKVSPGDHVIVSWIKGSGIEAVGPKYRAGGIFVNAGPIATLAESAVVSEDRVTPIAKDLPLDEAALIACAVATGTGSVWNVARPKPGDSVAVFGAGGVGLNAIQAARAARADKVIAVDVRSEVEPTTRLFGATHFVDASATDPVESIRDLTGGQGVDCAVECSGSARAMEAAFASVRDSGGKAVLAGNLRRGERISIDPFMLISGKTIVGSWGGATDPDVDFPKLVASALSGEIELRKLVSHRLPLERANEGFELLGQGKVLRALVVF